MLQLTQRRQWTVPLTLIQYQREADWTSQSIPRCPQPQGEAGGGGGPAATTDTYIFQLPLYLVWWTLHHRYQEKKKHQKKDTNNSAEKKHFFCQFVRFHVKLVHKLRNIHVKPGKITKKWPSIFFWMFVFFFRFRILNEWMTNHLFRGKKNGTFHQTFVFLVTIFSL